MALHCFLFPYLLLHILASNMADANLAQHKERSARANLVSFRPMNKTLLLGLDMVVPFITVPTGKDPVDEFGFPKALMNIDTAAVVISSLVTGGALIMGHLFRTFPLLIAESKEEAAALLQTSRSGKKINDNVTNMFKPFKLIYSNATGERVETSLTELLANMENSFLEHDIDFAACIEKSICCMVHESGDQLKIGKASGVHKIVDGLTHLNWLLGLLQHTALSNAIEAGRMGSSAYCDFKYPLCKWSAPQVKIQKFLSTNVRFT